MRHQLRVLMELESSADSNRVCVCVCVSGIDSGPKFLNLLEAISRDLYIGGLVVLHWNISSYL